MGARWVTSIAELISLLPNDALLAPHPKTAENRRNAMLNMLKSATTFIGANQYQKAIAQLRDIAAKTDGKLSPYWISGNACQTVRWRFLNDTLFSWRQICLLNAAGYRHNLFHIADTDHSKLK